MDYIEINKENVDNEHICCAISDKKCKEGYEGKKSWLKTQFEHGYKFIRLNERAKVFIEYGPSEFGWAPIEAENYLLINCFWVSGKYKGHGHGKALLSRAMEDAKKSGKSGLVTVVGKKKFHFMSDTKFLKLQGFTQVDETEDGFILLVKKLDNEAPNPSFKQITKTKSDFDDDLLVYYSDRCPFNSYYVNQELTKTAKNRDLSLKIIKVDDYETAQNIPTPASIFSLYYKGSFVTTDVGVCLDNRYEKIMKKAGY